jgi:hypothetical protein
VADFWYIVDGEIKDFNRQTSMDAMLWQMGVFPDFAAAVAVSKW